MPTYSPQTATFSDIILNVQKRLADELAVAIDYIKIVASDDYRIQCEESKFLYIRFYGPQPVTDAGAGRRATPVSRRVRLYLYSRSSLDTVGEDTIVLTDPDLGQSAFEEKAYAALLNYAPVDRAGTALTIEPLHPLDSSSGPPERKPEDDDGLIRSALDFEVRYLLKIDVTDPAA